MCTLLDSPNGSGLLCAGGGYGAAAGVGVSHPSSRKIKKSEKIEKPIDR